MAKRWGTERVYALSLLGFTAASGLCALAPTVPVLVTIRILQGAFGALLVPLAMHMLLGGDRARSRMSSAAGMVLFLAPAIGPALGGLLIQAFGWPAIFLINVPVGAVAMWGTRHIPPDLAAATGGAGRFDGVGFGLLAAGVVGLSCGAALGPSQGWLASGVWPYWAAGAMLLLGYARWAPHTSCPVLDLHLLHDFQASLKLFLTAIVSVVMFAMVFLVPVYLQDVQGRTATAAGLTLLPQGLVTGVGTFIGLTLPQRWGL
ncbi:MAG: MFS transporter [Clostridia bacterium]